MYVYRYTQKSPVQTSASKSPQSVQRIFGILEFLAHSENGETLASIARYLESPKNSVVSLLAGMLLKEHITRDEQAVYRLGPAMLALSASIVGGMNLPGLVRPALERLMEETGETALAGILPPGAEMLTYIEKAESRNPMRYTVPVGERRELYCTAMGKLILAFMDPAEQAKYLKRVKLAPLTRTTITSARKLKAEIAAIRETGVASTSDERIAGASAIAAAVVDKNGKFVVGIGIVGPSVRLGPRATEHRSALVREAREMSRLVAGAAGALTLRP